MSQGPVSRHDRELHAGYPHDGHLLSVYESMKQLMGLKTSLKISGWPSVEFPTFTCCKTELQCHSPRRWRTLPCDVLLSLCLHLVRIFSPVVLLSNHMAWCSLFVFLRASVRFWLVVIYIRFQSFIVLGLNESFALVWVLCFFNMWDCIFCICL